VAKNRFHVEFPSTAELCASTREHVDRAGRPTHYVSVIELPAPAGTPRHLAHALAQASANVLIAALNWGEPFARKNEGKDFDPDLDMELQNELDEAVQGFEAVQIQILETNIHAAKKRGRKRRR
jgi:hypothetical protein